MQKGLCYSLQHRGLGKVGQLQHVITEKPEHKLWCVEQHKESILPADIVGSW